MCSRLYLCICLCARACVDLCSGHDLSTLEFLLVGLRGGGRASQHMMEMLSQNYPRRLMPALAEVPPPFPQFLQHF